MNNFDLIGPKEHPAPMQYAPPRRRNKKHLFLLLLLLVISLGVWGGGKIISKTNQIFTNKQNVFVRFGNFFMGDDRQLQGEERGLVNVLLIGMGGPGHEGPLLTDTMIVAQINTLTKEAVLISVPRDFVISVNNSFTKINAIYAYAEAKEGGGGGPAALAAVEKLTGLEVPYFTAIDFKGFVKAVDHVGGLDIYVDRSFTDNTYPDERFGYLPPVTFTQGQEHMNGLRSLQFVRSRHGNSGEGSDFARSERQKKIITAFGQKVIKLNLTDVRTLSNLLNDFTQNFRTNLEPYELKRLTDVSKNISPDNIYSLSLEPQGDLICQGIIEDYVARAYVIQPCEGKTYQDIHAFLSDALAAGRLNKEKAAIEIQNSTGKPYALDSLQTIIDTAYSAKVTSFKSKTPYERTILYDNSNGKFPQTLDYLKNNFNFTLADIPYANSSADFVIILGKDAL